MTRTLRRSACFLVPRPPVPRPPVPRPPVPRPPVPFRAVAAAGAFMSLASSVDGNLRQRI